MSERLEPMVKIRLFLNPYWMALWHEMTVTDPGGMATITPRTKADMKNSIIMSFMGCLP